MFNASHPDPGADLKLSCRRPLSFGERRLDSFFGPLEPGKVHLLESTTHFIFDAVYMAMAEALRDPEARVVFVDGGNRMNPYALVRLCKRFRLDPDRCLERVLVSRAFTAYQMSSIIEDSLEPQLSDGALLIVSQLQALYQDKDVWYREAEVLVKRASEHVRALTERHGTVTLVTDVPHQSKSDFGDILAENSDRHLRFLNLRRRLRLQDARTGRSVDYLPVPLNQAILDDYGVL